MSFIVVSYNVCVAKISQNTFNINSAAVISFCDTVKYCMSRREYVIPIDVNAHAMLCCSQVNMIQARFTQYNSVSFSGSPQNLPT